MTHDYHFISSINDSEGWIVVSPADGSNGGWTVYWSETPSTYTNITALAELCFDSGCTSCTDYADANTRIGTTMFLSSETPKLYSQEECPPPEPSEEDGSPIIEHILYLNTQVPR